jgi:hypothetical protein
MISDWVSTYRFEEATGLAKALTILQQDASFAQPLGQAVRHEPVVYVLGPDGTQFSKATLLEETLTDGSKVYHIQLEA